MAKRNQSWIKTVSAATIINVGQVRLTMVCYTYMMVWTVARYVLEPFMANAIVSRPSMHCHGYITHGTSRLYHPALVSMWFTHRGLEAWGCVNHVETSTSWYNLYVICKLCLCVLTMMACMHRAHLSYKHSVQSVSFDMTIQGLIQGYQLLVLQEGRIRHVSAL